MPPRCCHRPFDGRFCSIANREEEKGPPDKSVLQCSKGSNGLKVSSPGYLCKVWCFSSPRYSENLMESPPHPLSLPQDTCGPMTVSWSGEESSPQNEVAHCHGNQGQSPAPCSSQAYSRCAASGFQVPRQPSYPACVPPTDTHMHVHMQHTARDRLADPVDWQPFNWAVLRTTFLRLVEDQLPGQRSQSLWRRIAKGKANEKGPR